MKRIAIFGAIFSLISFPSFAKISDGFFLKSFATLEYSAPEISGGGVNTNFKSEDIFDQLKDLNNLALGMHFRIHKFVGLNANVQKTEMENSSVPAAIDLSKKAEFNAQHFNFSALFYAPIIEDMFELFAEIGVADFNSKLTYTTSGGTFFQQKAHETKGIYGIGFQVNVSEESDDAIRFSYQKYAGKLALLDANYATVRLGYIKSF